jgi:hypothetical protein
MLKIPRVTNTTTVYFIEQTFQPSTPNGIYYTPIYGVKHKICIKKYKCGVELLKNRLKISSFFFTYETQDSVIQYPINHRIDI